VSGRLPFTYPVLAVLLGTSTLGAQSLGEAAAKEQERRKKAGSAAKAPVITEDELRNAKGANVSNAVGERAASEASPGKEPASGRPSPATAASDEGAQEGRRARADQLKESLRSAQEAVHIAEQRVAEAQRQADFVDRMPINSYTRHGATIREQRRAALAQEQQRLKAARARLDSLETQARRERIPPGWLR
jgi:hypothetical protein